ncbi:hypothetical protein DFH09DRAFT_1456681 [Mycena vulgaris]|nr:hypothetical protein DFH09DRAFT_1456681 [Mycena vulgaris]
MRQRTGGERRQYPARVDPAKVVPRGDAASCMPARGWHGRLTGAQAYGGRLQEDGRKGGRVMQLYGTGGGNEREAGRQQIGYTPARASSESVRVREYCHAQPQIRRIRGGGALGSGGCGVGCVQRCDGGGMSCWLRSILADTQVDSLRLPARERVVPARERVVRGSRKTQPKSPDQTHFGLIPRDRPAAPGLNSPTVGWVVFMAGS